MTVIKFDHKNNKWWGALYVLSILVSDVGLNRLATVWEESGFRWPIGLTTYDCPIVEWIFLLLICISFFWFISWSVYYLCTAKDKSWGTRFNQLVNNTFSGSAYSLFSIMAFLTLLAWLPDACYEFVNSGRGLWGILINLLAMIALLSLRPICYEKEQVEPEERRVLLTGLSNISINAGKQLNLMPAIRPLEAYPNIDRIVVLLSDSVLFGIDHLATGVAKTEFEAPLTAYTGAIKRIGLPNLEQHKLQPNAPEMSVITGELTRLLQALIRAKYGREVEITYTVPVDYNRFGSCNDVCYRALQDLTHSKYKDREIVVNITPGTSIVSSVMLLNAIKGGREMVYVNQSTNKLITDETPDVMINHMNDWLQDKAEHSV